MQRRVLELDMLQIVKSMRSRSPSSLTPKTLLDYHRKCHMLYQGNIKRKPINKQFINSIVDLHDSLVKEMLKRKMKHTSPLKKV